MPLEVSVSTPLLPVFVYWGGYKTKMILQVHDELVFEVPISELEAVKKLVLDSMELGQPLKVKLEVDINTGSSWKEGE